MKSVLFSTSVTNFSRSASVALALGDVADDLRRPDDVAGVVLDRRDRQRHVDALAVTSHALGLEVLDPPPGLEARDDLVFFRDAIRRNDERDVAADRLLRRVAEQPLGGGVPALDDAVERLADDRVVRGLDDRREQPRVEQAAGLASLQSPPLGDVAEDQDAPRRPGRCSSLIGAALSSMGTLDAVLADEERVVGEADDGAVAQRPCRRVLERLAASLVDDAEDGLERLAARVLAASSRSATRRRH